jgi:hypothetical protein
MLRRNRHRRIKIHSRHGEGGVGVGVGGYFGVLLDKKLFEIIFQATPRLGFG